MLIIAYTECNYAECRIAISLTTAKSFVAQAVEGVPQSEGFKNAANCRKNSDGGFNGKNEAGNTNRGTRISTVSLLIKTASFCRKCK
jgi:hypothetical protein